MKRILYSLENEEFVFLINKLKEQFEKRKIQHTFVGGTAVQAHILDRLTKKYDSDIVSLISKDNVRLQDYIRSTDDIDLALDFEVQSPIDAAKQVKDICKAVEGEHLSDTGNYIFEFSLERTGAKRPIFGVAIDGERAEAIALNISHNSKDLKTLDHGFYKMFLDQGKELVIPHYQDCNLQIRVPKLEHVLATKISNFRAKDSMDLQNLVSISKDIGEKIDMEEIHSILGPENIKNYERFESLIGYDSE